MVCSTAASKVLTETTSSDTELCRLCHLLVGVPKTDETMMQTRTTTANKRTHASHTLLTKFFGNECEKLLLCFAKLAMHPGTRP